MAGKIFEIDMGASDDDWLKFLEELNAALEEEPQTAPPENPPIGYPWMQWPMVNGGDES